MQTYRVKVQHLLTRWHEVKAISPEAAIERAINRIDDGVCTPIEEFSGAEIDEDSSLHEAVEGAVAEPCEEA